MNITFTFRARLAFSMRNGPSRTCGYGEGSIVEEKVNIARKVIQGNWLCQLAGKAGV